MKKSRFAQLAAERSNRMFLGTLIKYVKGEWQEGPDKAQISSGQRFVALMDTASTGHMKWFGGKSVDHRMGLIADGFHPLHRNELGDLDSEFWEVDDDDARKDPWQKTDLLLLAALNPPHDLFTFTTTSQGGEDAIGALCGAHARTTENVQQYPVVTLASDFYDHKIKSRGRIHVPIFKIVDSVDAAPFNALVAEARGGAVFIPTSLPAPETSGMGIEVESQPQPARPTITSGRASFGPPEPPEPTAPPLDHDGGPDDGFYSDTSF